VRRRSKSRWISYPLLVLALVVRDLVVAPAGPAANVAINLLSNLRPMLLKVGVKALGQQLYSEHIAVSPRHLRKVTV
jgi:hypothetical protein